MLLTPDKSGLEQAAISLTLGELVAFPTDTFFALGADGLNPAAVESIYLAKGRNPDTPVPLLISDIDMGMSLSRDFPDVLKELAERFWPGALTIVVPAADVVPVIVTAGTGTVGLRIPGHEVAIELIQIANTPLTGTSCNLTGRPPIKEASVIEQTFRNQIAACIDAPCGENSDPSTVVSYVDDKVTVVRLGAISADSLRKIVGDIVVS
jgi:L-threonylcarbamoyladenylate synthase